MWTAVHDPMAARSCVDATWRLHVLGGPPKYRRRTCVEWRRAPTTRGGQVRGAWRCCRQHRALGSLHLFGRLSIHVDYVIAISRHWRDFSPMRLPNFRSADCYTHTFLLRARWLHVPSCKIRVRPRSNVERGTEHGTRNTNLERGTRNMELTLVS